MKNKESNHSLSLHFAAEENNLWLARQLVQSGHHLDVLGVDGQSALYVAVEAGHVVMARYLSRSGASAVGPCGRSLLHAAVLSESMEMLRFVIGQGYCDFADDGGLIPSFLAADMGLWDMYDLIMDSTDDAAAGRVLDRVA